MLRKNKILMVLISLVLVIALAVGCAPKKDSEVNSDVDENKDVVENVEKSIDFPNRPVKILVARGAGGSTDVVARTFQPYFQKYLGANIIVENMSGGGTKIGTSAAYHADPDGYTLLLGNWAADLLTDSLDPAADYTYKDFEILYNVAGEDYNALITGADSKLNSFEDIMEAAKERTLTLATTSGISNSQLALAMLTENTGIEFNIVPYDAGGDAINAAVGGHVDLTMASVVRARDLQEEGLAKVLIGFASKRDEILADVPMFNEFYDGVYAETLQPLLAPPGTPAEILAILEDAANKAVNDPDFINAAYGSFGIQPLDSEELKVEQTSLYQYAVDYKDTLLELVGIKQ